MLTAGAMPLAVTDVGKAAPLGLLVILLLCLAVYLLGRSMATHLKKVPASFDPPAGDPEDPRGPAPDGETRTDTP